MDKILHHLKCTGMMIPLNANKPWFHFRGAVSTVHGTPRIREVVKQMGWSTFAYAAS